MTTPLDVTTQRSEAQARRAALLAAGCSTYLLRAKRWHGLPCAAWIICLCCGKRSFHPMDIQEKFCGFCQCWHEEKATS